MSLDHCKACTEKTIYPLWIDRHNEQWYRCLFCGSDSCDASYDAKAYDADYNLYHHHAPEGQSTKDYLRRQLTSNIGWFQDYKVDTPGRDFLDVGCSSGEALELMQENGWSVHGFDVNPFSRKEGCTTIAPFFSADIMPQQYDAVLCREVIEHVDTPMQFITDLYRVTKTKGFLQLQTPMPSAVMHDHLYAKTHLVIMSPFWIRYWLEKLGFEIKDYRVWPLPNEAQRQPGMAFMCKKI